MKRSLTYLLIILVVSLLTLFLNKANAQSRSVDSTWCPIFQHEDDCKFRRSPWKRKGIGYYRIRLCKKHEVKQRQYAIPIKKYNKHETVKRLHLATSSN